MEEKTVYGGLRESASFGSHRLVFTPDKISIKTTWTTLFFYSIFFIAGAGFFLGVVTAETDTRSFVIGTCLSGVFMIVGGGLIAFELLRKYPEIDLRRRIFYPKGSPADSGDMTDLTRFKGIPLAELKEMRTGSYEAHGKNSSYTVYTFDLVFRNGDEYRLISHGNYSDFKEDSEKVMKLLDPAAAGSSDLAGEGSIAKRQRFRGNGEKRNGIFAIFFGIAWTWIALGIFFSVDVPVMKAGWRAAKWQVETAVVEAAQVVPEGSEHFVAEVTFSYRFKGKDYLSKRVGVIQTNYNSVEDAKKALKKYPLKSKVQCFVDPENPENAVLERALPSSFYFIFLPITLLFVIIGVVILVNGVRDVFKNYLRRS
ncbi:MAG: DUF3592 domain-containing protein [Lentisphaeria bacterium]|nr:DUF3592 domain-containing protein [Lentisphaeria bacterium]